LNSETLEELSRRTKACSGVTWIGLCT
jgi:hypothetical protein